MTCGDFERLIALDVEGDLGPPEAARVRGHLETCGDCRAVARGLRDSQAELKALASLALDEQAVAAWRRGVLARLDAVPPRRFRWQWALAAAAVVFVLIAARALLRYQPPAPPPVVARVASPLVALPGARSFRPRVRRRRPAPPTAPLLVKLETPDPNVVIYWIVEGKGD